MDFSMTEEQSALLEAVGSILTDREEAAGSAGAAFDASLWQKLADGELLALTLAEDRGGLGFGTLELALVLESCGKELANVPLLEHSVALAALARFADEEFSARILTQVSQGSLVLSAALFDADPTMTGVSADADGVDYILSGRVPFVPFADDADRILIAVRREGVPALAVIDPRDPAVELIQLSTTSARPEADLILNGLRLGASEVFGDARAIRWAWERGVVGTCALLIGIAGRALEMTVSHVNGRKQFGRTLSSFQAVAIHVGSAYIDLECARVTMLEAAWLLDDRETAAREVGIAKYWASTASARIAETAQHLHGGIGVTTEFPLHRYFLWARHLQLWSGSAPFHISELAARALEAQNLCMPA